MISSRMACLAQPEMATSLSAPTRLVSGAIMGSSERYQPAPPAGLDTPQRRAQEIHSPPATPAAYTNLPLTLNSMVVTRLTISLSWSKAS
jgi:hypothetical protein